ncbi:hypothetical protein E6O75_ATG03995 [Venturia nashicola]|uniref:Protein sip5 n=1 Tax=Venturia nashicola TaxID=86259 RepID=A0A4Z1PM55_9PEZI|nr:hypothetical protein E6O75_ATG03995 [Venturia nashicola]
MGNNATKEARSASQSQQHPSAFTAGDQSSIPPTTNQSSRHSERPGLGEASQSARRRAGNRHDLSIFGLGHSHERDPADPTHRRETRAERDARKLEKERAAREKERERSTKEEGVDGGYLVTLGTYTGTEDFSKPVVRQLMIERRLAPFWQGLQDHENSWTENQLVAAAKGLPIPPADQNPPEDSAARAASRSSSSPRGTDNHLSVPTQHQSLATSTGEHLQTSLHGFTTTSPTPFGSPPSSSPFFRGRAKTLAALTTSRNSSQQDMTPQELQLPKDPYVHGRLLEAFLYKDASECPICFLYYPPYLNKTRCCDQPICSECFVQIKRPDPHPPEHHDDPDNPHPPEISGPADEYHLISEPATCPFCKQPELGITYDPPPFRRGLTYGDQHRLGASVMSAMSSSSSVNSTGQNNGASSTRRRTTSLGANSPTVITTDKIRPDWAKKLSDARNHALRRAAAATALHNAAYVLGNNGGENAPRLAFGRRRRTLFGNEGPNDGGLGFGHVGQLLAATERRGSASTQTQGQSDLFPGRASSRRSRMEDLEDLMMAEAMRLSLATEEERKKREEKENEKKTKKDEKQKAKDAKKAEKATKKVHGGMYSAGNASGISHFTGSPEISSSGNGKGKAPERNGEPLVGGFIPLAEPTSTINTTNSPSPPPADPQAQRHLEQSRANIQVPISAEPSLTALLSPPAAAVPPPAEQPAYRHALRQLSNASSSASSFQESGGEGSSSFEASPNTSGIQVGRLPTEDAPVSESPGTEPMFNFRSLAAVIGNEDKDPSGNMVTHIEDASAQASPLSPNFPNAPLGMDNAPAHVPESSGGNVALLDVPTPPTRPLSTGERLFGVASTKPTTDLSPSHSGVNLQAKGEVHGGVPLSPQASNQYDAKHYGDISVLDSGPFSTGPFSAGSAR